METEGLRKAENVAATADVGARQDVGFDDSWTPLSLNVEPIGRDLQVVRERSTWIVPTHRRREV
jgi:hypothetical protein